MMDEGIDMTKERKADKQEKQEKIEPRAEITETQAPAGQAGEADELMARLAKAEEKCEEYLNLAQRVQADFENFRRRNQSVRADAVQDGANEVLTQLLPVVDNLERAVEAAAQTEQTAAMRDGVEMVLRQLLDVTSKFGVTEINRLGEPFDPTLENAVLQGGPEEGEPGTVCEVFQKGYRTSGKVLRHAMVKVVVG